jgi:AcrR family transcriptional regulator
VITQSAESSRRQRILEAALDLFAAKGFDRTSTKEIAHAAGVAEGLIFHHFESKERLLTAVFETRRSYFGDLRELSSAPPDLPVEDVLLRLATDALTRLRRERRIAVVLFTTAQTNPAVRARLDAVIRAGTGHLAGYLVGRRDRGDLRPDLDVEAAAFAFLSPLFLHFLIHRDLPDPEWETRSTAFARGLVSTWLQGSRGV